ncbi:MAG: aminoacyl-tRNA hydrolase [Candidatus Aminicenantaceae bacterium]
MWAVVGLGNPGRKYTSSRHNVGFDFIKRLARRWNTRARKRSHLSKVVGVDRPEGKVLLVMPQTFMNSSGRAVQSLADQGGIQTGRMVVVYDDFDLPLGEIRVRREGSGGSHKGMGSIIEELGTRDIARIRIGIGPLPEEADPVEYVLSPFTEKERQQLADPLERAAEALEMILAGDIDAAMNRFNAAFQPPAL